MKAFGGTIEEFFAGEGLFETLLVDRGRIAFGPGHLARLRSSARELGFFDPPADDWVLGRLTDHISAAGLVDRSVRLNLRVDRTSLTFLTRMVDPAIDDARARGVAVITVHLDTDRRGRACHKWVERKALATAMRAAREAGAEEALLVAPDGCLLEGATSNVFCVIGGILRTPPTDARILPGVTRSALCAVASAAGIAVDDSPLDLVALRSADEVFLTSAVRMLVPVIAIDGRTLGDGKPGRVARDLAPRLWELAFGAFD